MSKPTQVFNGKTYTLHDGEKYFSSGSRKMHWDVWEYYNGPLPEGMDIHHIDFNPHNNDIENLECLTRKDHRNKHKGCSKKRREHLESIRPMASEWHSSEEGREWHSRHGKESWKNREPEKRICEYCNCEFETLKRGKVRFCSNKCKAGWRRHSGIDDAEFPCKRCGEMFVTNKYARAKYCSDACREK